MPKFKSSLSGEDRYNFMISLAGYLIRQQGAVEISQVCEAFDLSEDVVKSALGTLNMASAKFESRPEDLFFDVDQDLLDEGIISLSHTNAIQGAPRLSTRQASAISAGLQYLANIPEFANHSEIQELLDLLGQARGSASQSSIQVRSGSMGSDIALIRQAIVAGKVIRCEYVNSKGERRQREIEPIQVSSSGQYWYLFGYCPERQAGRNFRLDRMRAVSQIERSISDAARQIDDTDRPTYIAEDSDVEVLVEVQPEAYRLIAESQTIEEPKDVGNGAVRAVIKVGHLPNLGRVIARYGGAAKVIEPEAARAAVRAYALRVLGEEQSSLENED